MHAPLQKLIDDFSVAARELSVMYSAKQSAEVSEHDTQLLLEQLSAQNGLYVTPHDMSEEMQTEFMARSSDSQLKKMQASQISYATQSQIEKLEHSLLSDFKGKRVTFTALSSTFKPFDALWLKANNNTFEPVNLTAKQVKGTIHDISLSQNVVVIKPGVLQRKINPNRMFFLVYVIDPSTLRPGVSIS